MTSFCGNNIQAGVFFASIFTGENTDFKFKLITFPTFYSRASVRNALATMLVVILHQYAKHRHGHDVMGGYAFTVPDM
jgi:hypothetical protein